MKEEIQKIKNGVEKVVVNTGIGKFAERSDFKNKILPSITNELTQITGQKASERPSRKSIAGFGVREGDTVGLKTTLRGQRMADFLIKVYRIALPRVRDFRGIDLRNVDPNGNLNIGFEDQSVFPEINMGKTKIDFGLQVTVVPKNFNRDEAIKFYRSLGIPLKKEKTEA